MENKNTKHTDIKNQILDSLEGDICVTEVKKDYKEDVAVVCEFVKNGKKGTFRYYWEYKEIDLRRGYFSAFTPIEGTPLEKQQATPLEREHRLYQTDWLLRLYHIRLPEIKAILTDNNNLPKGDPKIFLADQYFGEKGYVDPNTAPKSDLLRVPGIGITSANRIMQLRRNKITIKSREQLHSIGVVLKRADSYLKINGYRQNKLDRFIPRGLKIKC